MKPAGYKGMDSEDASLKKIAGHVNEEDYAKLIGGEVNKSGQTKKTDVLDSKHGTHSVKSGKKWQIFLFSRSRLDSNTILAGLGNISSLLLNCIDALPQDRAQREANRSFSKLALQEPMRALASELKNPKLLRAFLQKAAFDADKVDYLAILPASFDQTEAKITDKRFYVFDAEEVVNSIFRKITVTNSKRGGKGQVDAQKVVFRYEFDSGKCFNIGEIEIRTDISNYRRAKMWFDAKRILTLLQENIPEKESTISQIHLYGKAEKLNQLNK